jgi:hypothetical protein
MSITIKHLDSPPKVHPAQGEQVFYDDTTEIAVGRSREGQVVYREEFQEVDGEHLKLIRDNATGAYTIQCGSCDVEIDGKPVEETAPVTYGSVVRVGVDGPTFECLPSGLVIRHREGPLAGQQQYFPDGVKRITFGRPPESTDVSYPQDYTKIGRFHFALKQKGIGNYCVELTPSHYVEIDKEPAKNQSPVKSGSTFRLGSSTGPSFDVLIEQPEKEGAKTEVNYEPPSERKLIKQLAAASLAALLVGGGVLYWRDWQHDQQVRQLAASLADADAKVSALAEKQIPAEAQEALQAAVYLVAKIEGGTTIGQATAWAFEPDKLATNAHVTEAIKGHEDDFVLIGPNKNVIKIAKVESHPGYAAFKDYKQTLGRQMGDKFKPLDVINEYDVGIIYPAEPLPADPKTGQVVLLDRATEDSLESLKPGAAVASVGFPIEGMTGSLVVTEAPSALRFGNISALTDVFMCRADPKDLLLIQHSVPVTGGVSGSPLIDASGKVIGIVNGGNTATVLKSAEEDDKIRIPSAALINFAQRVDLLDDLLRGAAERQLADDQSYWKEAAKKFTSYFESADEAFVALAAERYGVEQGEKQITAKGRLEPRKPGTMSFVSATHSMVLQPGHLYGFIADAESGVRIALNVKKQGTAEFLRDAKDPRQTSVPELAPTAWVTVQEPTPVEVDVLAMTAQPADYTIYVYDWSNPALDMPATDASAEARQ